MKIIILSVLLILCGCNFPGPLKPPPPAHYLPMIVHGNEMVR